MALFDSDPLENPGVTPLGELTQPKPAAAPDVEAVLGAAFRESGPLGSVVRSAQTLGFMPVPAAEPGYNPFEHPRVKGTYLERDYGSVFAGDRSAGETEGRIQQIERERADRELMDSAGWGGTVVQMGLGLIDPTMWFLPAGATVRAARGGFSVGRSAASIGLAGAVQGAVSEAIMQSADETRTATDSAFAIGASTVLSGILGAGAASFLTGAERRNVERLLMRDKQALAGSTAMTPPDAVRDAGIGVRSADDVGESALPGSVGAAAADTREARPIGYGLDKVPVLSTAVEKMDPTLRILQSRFTSARRVGADLFESALATVDNLAGQATARRGIGAAETEIMLARRQTDYALSEVMDDAWKRLTFGSADEAPAFAAERVAIARKFGSGDERMTMESFREEVGKAMRRKDQHEVLQVQEVAQWMRANVFEPWKERAIRSGHLPEDVEPTAAESYFMRVYNTEKMKSRPDEFVRQRADYLDSEQTRKAELQSRLQDLDERRGKVVDDGKRARAKIERLEERQKETEARAAERGMEAGRTQKRSADLQERVWDQEAEIADLGDAIRTLTAQARDPATLDRIADLEKQAADLRKRERMSRMTPADLDRADEAELRSGFLRTDEDRTFADLVMGRKKPPREPSFADFIASGGGIRGSDADVAAIVGEPRLTKKLTGGLDAPTLDDWTERLWERFPAQFPQRPEPNVVLDTLDASMRGQTPFWFIDGMMTATDARLIELGRIAADTRQEMGRLGYALDSRLDVARFLRDHSEATPAGPRPVEGFPEGFALDVGLDALGAARDKVSAARDAVAAARSRTDQVEIAARRNRVRLSEAGGAAKANAQREAALVERQAIEARYREVLDATVRQADEMHVGIRGEMEDILREWGGNSAREAVSALRARDKVLSERETRAAAGFEAGSGRPSSADGAVDSAVRRIIGSDRSLSRQEHEARAREIMDRIISSPDGRLPYDEKTAGGPSFSSGRNAPRGALARRADPMPDHLLEDWLESDAEMVSKRFLRGVVPEIVLTERFGDAMLTDDIRKVMDEAQALASGKGEDEARQIFGERDAAIRDLAAIRDRIKGTYALSGDARTRNLGRVVGMVRNFNTMADLGGSMLSSIPDVAGTVFRYGFTRVLGDAWMPFVRSLAGAGEGYKLAREQYRAMGIGVETALATRSVALDDVSAAYRPQSRLERALNTGAEKFQLLNLQAPWTDLTKTVAAVVSGNEILRAAKAVTEGVATEKQIRDLASSNIEAGMARKIWASFQGSGGRIEDGVHLPNTGAWSDRNARLAFESAVLRETNITVVTPGQEKPLWMSNPTFSLLGQHKSFVVAATQRILLANLQRSDAATLSGLITAISAGALSATLYSLASGKDMPDGPNQLLKEAISRSGVLGWLEEANTMAAKATGGGVDAFRLIGADKPLSRFSSQNISAMLLGPTAGKIESLQKITRAPFSEEGWDARTTEATRRLLPMQNLIGLRLLLNQVEDRVNEAFGIEPLDRK